VALGSLLLNKSAPHKVRIGVRLDLIVLQATDGSIDLEHGQSNIATLGNSVLAQRALQFVHADMFFLHVRLNDLSIVNQKAGLTLHYAPEPATGAGKSTDKVVQQQQSGGRHHAPDERGIRAGHGVLHRIRKKKKEREVERRHLPDLTLAAKANTDQHYKIDDSRAQCDLQRNIRTRRKQHSVQLAVTGTGAAFGVLR
jgi:hypothetical protein